jgi:hypothetical protein
MVALLVCSILFVAGGLWMAQEKPVQGYLGVAFFGLCAVVFVIQLLPNSSYLLLASEGFTFCGMFRKHFFQWSDIHAFSVFSFSHSGNMVGWKFSSQYQPQPGMRRLNKNFFGVEAGLPITYGMKAEELAELMNGLSLRYGGKT